MIDLRAIDFASWDNARAIARADSGADVGIDGWVLVYVRGVEINYHVSEDFAYCVVTDKMLPILSDFTWNEECDRFECFRK